MTNASPYTVAIALRQTHRRAVTWLKQQGYHWRRGASRMAVLPHCIVIGDTAAGKSSLLKALAPECVLLPGSEQEAGLCSYVDKNILLTKLQVLLCDVTQNKPTRWQALVSVVQRWRMRRLLSAVIVCVDCQKLLLPNEQEQQISYLMQQIKQLKTVIGNATRLLIVLTKADVIYGFNEFFSDLKLPQRNQGWGISLTAWRKGTDIAALFESGFSGLLQQLQSSVIDKLQQEKQRKRRELIVDFPLQLESLQPAICAAVTALHQAHAGAIVGCYFTSVQQQGTVTDSLHKTLGQIFELQTVTPQAQPIFMQKKYFAQALGALLLAPRVGNAHSTYYRWLLPCAFYITSAVMLVGGSVVWGYNLRQQTQQLSAVQSVLHRYTVTIAQQQSAPTLKTLLPALELLQDIHTRLTQPQHGFAALGTLHPSKQLLSRIQTIYAAELQHRLLPALQHAMEDQLQQPQTDTHYLYRLLNAYLLLDTQRPEKEQGIVRWLQSYADEVLHCSQEQQQRLLTHVKNLNVPSLPRYAINHALLEAPRAQLLDNLSEPELAMLILQSKHDTKIANPLAAVNLQPIFRVSSLNKTMPLLYNKQELELVYTTLVKQVAQETLEGNWVLGKKTAPAEVSLKQVQAYVKNLYLSAYMQWWQTQLQQLRPEKLSTFAQAIDTLHTLANTQHSVLRDIIGVTREQTHIPSVNQTLYAHPTFLAFNNLLEPDTEQATLFQQIQQQLGKSANYIDNIAHARDPDKAAFVASRAYMLNETTSPLNELLLLADRTPSPLGDWLRAWAQDSWALVLGHSKAHINSMWQTNVLPFYQQHLFNRYPLFASSKQDINLAEFNAFFSPIGMLHNFFQDYIKPFLDTKEARWENKTIDGVGLDLSRNVLELFMRGNVITHMFFPDKTDTTKVAFTLQPMQLGSQVKSIDFKVSQDAFTDYPDSSVSHSVIWPSRMAHAGLVFHLTNEPDGLTIDEKGDWALFRALQHAQLIPNNDDPSEYQLYFGEQGYNSRYRLHTPALVNAFMPGILDHFRCPLALT